MSPYTYTLCLHVYDPYDVTAVIACTVSIAMHAVSQEDNAGRRPASN